MTDHSSSEPPGPPDAATTAAEDELVSAVLDGEATPEDRALVESNPRLRMRLDSFARVRESVRSVPPVADATRDASLAAALDASLANEAHPQAAVPEPTVLAVERARRRRQIATIVAAAAVVLIAIPLLAIALTGRGAEQDMTATGASANESSDALSSEGDGAADAAPSSTTVAQAPDAAAQRGLAPFFVGDLGSIATASQLRAEVEGALFDAGRSIDSRTSAGPTSTTAPAAPSAFDAGGSTPAACGAAVAAGDPTVGSLVLTATATWSGEPAIVLVFRTVVPAAAGEQTDALTDVIVLVRPDCTTIGRFVA